MLRMRRFPWSAGDLPAVVFIWEDDVKTCVLLVMCWILLFLVAAVWHWRGRPAGIPSTWVALCELQVEGGNLSLEWILRSGARSAPEASLSKVSSSWCRISEVLKWWNKWQLLSLSRRAVQGWVQVRRQAAFTLCASVSRFDFRRKVFAVEGVLCLKCEFNLNPCAAVPDQDAWCVVLHPPMLLLGVGLRQRHFL